MTRYVAFLRAINVGGHVVKMDHLRVLFEELGFGNVKTFIASGNVLFESSAKNTKALEDKIAKALRDALGYEVAVFIRTAAEVSAISTQGDSGATEGSLFVGFLPGPLDAREQKIVSALQTPVDDLRVHQREIYWRAKQNFRDALFQPAKLEKLLGKPATFRNVNTVRRIAALLAKPLLLLALLMPQDASSQVPTLPIADVVTYRGLLVRDWVSAVLGHTPGVDDEALAVVRRWGAEDLRDAWVSVHVMVALLEDPTRRGFVVPQQGNTIPVTVASQDLHMMATRAQELLQRPGRNHFLKRAAVLHTDAALLAGSERPRPPFNSSFLLPQRVFVQTGDGTQAGLYGGDVNWEFGRILLDGVADAGRDREVQDWYGATLAYMLAVDHLDNPHFDHALELFPRTAEILFLKGCLHESLADPRVQSVIDEIKLPPRTVLDVKSQRWELSQAERLFRRALEISPAHDEARLRHGRTLGRLGRHQEAASELKNLLDAPEPLLQYYASLFLAAEEEALARFDRARAMYERALALVPSAQVPRLGLSQLVHRTGDRAAARAALEPLLKVRDGTIEDDPWWVYSISCGRDANDRMLGVYRAVFKGPQ